MKVAAHQVGRSIDLYVLITVVNAAIKYQGEVRIIYQQVAVKLFLCKRSFCADIVIGVALEAQRFDVAINIQLYMVRVKGPAGYFFLQCNGAE